MIENIELIDHRRFEKVHERAREREPSQSQAWKFSFSIASPYTNQAYTGHTLGGRETPTEARHAETQERVVPSLQSVAVGGLLHRTTSRLYLLASFLSRRDRV